MPIVPKPLPSASYLAEALRLDAENGHLYWREDRPSAHFATTLAYLSWISRCPGKRADQRSTKNYRRVRLKRVFFAAHRIIFKMVHGFDPIPCVDHIDHNPSNNRPENLRACSQSENMRNRIKTRSRRSGSRRHSVQTRELPVGVYILPNGKYRAQRRINDRAVHLGTFSDVDSAKAAFEQSEAR